MEARKCAYMLKKLAEIVMKIGSVVAMALVVAVIILGCIGMGLSVWLSTGQP